MIPHSRPTIGTEEAQEAARVIESGQLAQGMEVEQFEEEFARRIGVRHATAVSSGTAALHLALLSMEIGPGDEVIIPSYVCAALLNAVHHAGAEPVLADIDPVTYNLDPGDVRARLTARTKAVIAPHLFGLPADLDGLLSLGVPIIEDCAQSVGGMWQGEAVGSFGDAAVFSFYATKVLTTGEGGMIVSDSQGLIDRARDLRAYDELDAYRSRYNYKMTDIQAAMGRVQLGRLSGLIGRRREIAAAYREALDGYGYQLPPAVPEHIYYRYVIGLRMDVGHLIERAYKEGIKCARPVFAPLHRLLGLAGYPWTEAAWRRSLSVPIYPSLSDAETNRVIDVMKAILEESSHGE